MLIKIILANALTIKVRDFVFSRYSFCCLLVLPIRGVQSGANGATAPGIQRNVESARQDLVVTHDTFRRK